MTNEEQQAQETLQRVMDKIKNSHPDVIKQDLTILATTILGFILGEEPKILDPNISESELKKVSLKAGAALVADITLGSMMPWTKIKNEQRKQKFMALMPIFKKYSS